jgi:hypothetical protein
MAKKKKMNIKIKHPGLLTNAADSAGLTVNQEAEKEQGSSGEIGKAARLYLNVFKHAKHPKHR